MVGWSMALGTLAALGTLGTPSAPALLFDVAGRSALLAAPR